MFTCNKVLIAAAMAAICGSSLAAPAEEFVRGRLIIETRAGVSDASVDGLIKSHGGKKQKMGQSRLYVVNLPANASEKAVMNALARRSEIKFVELDRAVRVNATSNDPYLGNQWHLPKVGATEAWNVTQGAGVTIAILDSGINVNHPDLSANLVAGYNAYNNNTDVTDVCGHGTAVAGVAAATYNNATGVAGVAGAAKIMPVRIATYDSTKGCFAYYSTIASGLTWAADHGARVANISYQGVSGSSAIMSAANYMKSKGGLVFASAGNNNIDENITNDGSMITVSATDSNNNKSSFSSWGNFVGLAAPGSYIMTTNKAGGYSNWNGTSFASPLAAGVAALVMSARPDLSNDQVQSLLYSTATDLGAVGKDPVFGYGLVNADAAVQAAVKFVTPPDTMPPSATMSALPSTVSGIVPINVKATDNVGVVRIDLIVNGTVVATDTAPFSFSWDSNDVANGKATLSVAAYDAAGNVGRSAIVTVNVANMTSSVPNDTTPPTVVINNPVGGNVNGNVSISASATDNAGAAGIKMALTIDGALVAQGTGGALGYNWNSKKAKSGSHQIVVTATDAAGNFSKAYVNVIAK